MAAERRRIEPWPIALAVALLAMIGASLAFYAIAVRHPDAELAPHDRPGLVAADRVGGEGER
jgi:hypothetical protein